MKGVLLMLLGALFAVIGVYFLYSGFILPTSVPNPAAVPGMEQVANLELMHIQTMNFLTGVGALIISALFWVGAAIVGSINPDA